MKKSQARVAAKKPNIKTQFLFACLVVLVYNFKVFYCVSIRV